MRRIERSFCSSFHQFSCVDVEGGEVQWTNVRESRVAKARSLNCGRSPTSCFKTLFSSVREGIRNGQWLLVSLADIRRT